MLKRIFLQTAGLTALLFAFVAPAWAVCNGKGVETGASSVVDLQGQGNFTCAQILGDPTACLNGGCTMIPASGFTYQINNIGSRKFVTWNAPAQIDKIFVTASGNGSRCLYDFEPGATSGSFLEPAGSLSGTAVVACTDGVNVAVPTAPEPPISTTTNCAEALPSLQNSLNNDGNLLAFIGIGTDQGLSGEGATDGDYVLAVCSAGGQTQCVDQCRQPTAATYACTPGTGTQCLSTRACATSGELPTGNADAPKYCWEFSHQVDLQAGTFIPPKEKESGSATWEQYSGSTCVKVTTSYRGKTYSYYSPTGCP